MYSFDFYVFLGTWFKHNWQMQEFLFVSIILDICVHLSQYY